MSRLRFVEGDVPATPPSGYGYLYSFTDSSVYWKNDAGVTFKLNGTMASQDSSNVAITGGTASFSTLSSSGLTTLASGGSRVLINGAVDDTTTAVQITGGMLLTSTSNNDAVWLKNSSNRALVRIDNTATTGTGNSAEVRFNGYDGATVSLIGQFIATDSLNLTPNMLIFRQNRATGAIRFDTNGSNQRMRIEAAGRVLINTSTDNGVDQLQVSGHIATVTAGNGFKTKEGSNAKQGTAVLVAGTVTVSNTSVTANSRIFLTSQVDGGTPGFVRVSARTAGTSFTITSSNAADTSTIAYEIFEPA